MDSALRMPKVNGESFKFSETPFCIAHKLSYLLQWIKMKSSGMLRAKCLKGTVSNQASMQMDIERSPSMKDTGKLSQPVEQKVQIFPVLSELGWQSFLWSVIYNLLFIYLFVHLFSLLLVHLKYKKYSYRKQCRERCYLLFCKCRPVSPINVEDLVWECKHNLPF